MSISRYYPPVADYTNKFESLIKTACQCRYNSSNRLLTNPVGIAVEYYTDNIYVVNQTTRKVFVFNREANLLFYFYIEGVTRNALFYFPAFISILNTLVFVELHFGRLLVFDLSGNFITKVKPMNTFRGGFAIDPANGDIYVCGNVEGEINVLSGDYPFAYQFANGIVGNKLDIKLTEDYIFVLSDKDPYMYVFNYNGSQLETQFPEYILKQLHLPFGLAIDGAGNLLVCNSDFNGYIFILDTEGKVLHKIRSSISKPRAITIDSNGRIITADCGNCIEIY